MGNCLHKSIPVHTVGSSTTSGSGTPPNTTSSTQAKSFNDLSPRTIGDALTVMGNGPGGSPRVFSYADLRTATRNFRPDSLLGGGGFGSVFKGFIDEQTFLPTRPGQGMVIAVKKLNMESLQGHKEWLTEVSFLGSLHHPNLVKLIGYCAEEDHRLIVYEFMSRGSLDNHLFRKGNHNPTLTWMNRMKIAVDAAKCLTFLHESHVIYRDFKSSNVLLDLHYNAKLSDFGLARKGPTGDNTHVSTQVFGTHGYAAPEYVATGHLTAKSDVYSFGVVLLEVLTGRRALEQGHRKDPQSLVEWAKPYLSDRSRLPRIVDQRLEGQYSRKGADALATAASLCLTQEPKARPIMREVLEMLEVLLDNRQLLKHKYLQGKGGMFNSHENRNRAFRADTNENIQSLINNMHRQANGPSPLQSPQVQSLDAKGFGKKLQT